MNPGIKKEKLWTLLSILSVISLFVFASPQTPKQDTTIPKTEAIEKELRNLVNKERELQNLPPLELSSALSLMEQQQLIPKSIHDIQMFALGNNDGY